MMEKALRDARQRSCPVLAIDMTAMWNRKTSGIQRVIRELSPFLARAAASHGWEIVLVRKSHLGLEELTRWTVGMDPQRLSNDLDMIASGRDHSERFTQGGFGQFVRRTARKMRRAKVGTSQLSRLVRRIRSIVPKSIRTQFRNWKSKHKRLCNAADGYLSFAGGILPAMPPTGTPPERTVIVIHDLIPLHFAQYYSSEMVHAFVTNITDLAFSPYSSHGRFITASRHVASDIDELFYSLARKRVAIDLTNWGYDRETFFPQEDLEFRRKFGLPSEGLIVTAVSTQDPRKRFAEIQAAVAAINAHAVFIGHGRARREPNATYLGHVADEVLRMAYSSCDVVVNWSAAEGFGLPTIEALACGARVVIPPDNPTSIEVGGDSVVIAERADVPALCAAIRRAASLPRPNQDLSRFDWSTAAELIESRLWPESNAYLKSA